MPGKMSKQEQSSKSRSPSRQSAGHSPAIRGRSSERRREKKRHHSRSPARSRSPKYRRRYSRSTRSHSSHYCRRRSYSRSPGYGPIRRYDENRQESRCIGIFGLSVFTDEKRIREIFSRFGPIERAQVVFDAKTGRSRGFCFVYFDEVLHAKIAKEECSGMNVDGRCIRVDYSTTQRPHTPTPGIYMGRLPRHKENDDKYRNGYFTSPYYRTSRRTSHRHRYESSRSRSYSPRHHRRRHRH